MLNKTKIIATIGPQSGNESTLEEMILAGVNVARFNFSVASFDEQKRYVELVRKVSVIHGRTVSLMLDTFGPKIRAKAIENDVVKVAKECKVVIHTKDDILGNENEFSINYPDFVNEVKVGDEIIVNSKSTRFEVLAVNDKKGLVECVVLKSGEIASNCLINIPHKKTSLPAISGEDLAVINFAIKTELDYLAISFVRDANDVKEVKALLKDNNSNIKVFAKIENAIAIDNFEEILAEADGIIIPRGDLSVEIDLESLPLIQKRLIRRCNAEGKPVVVGTQILSSMTRNKVPSRAEVADVANLVLDGVDALSLSNATTIGLYPVKACKSIAKIIKETEKGYGEFTRFNKYYSKNETLNDAVANSVKDTAAVVNAKLIVAFSESGATAKRISLLRPNCAIASVSSNHEIRNGLTLYWGIYPVVANHPTFEADFVNKASEIAAYYGLVEGDTFIITGGSGIGNTNFMKVCKL